MGQTTPIRRIACTSNAFSNNDLKSKTTLYFRTVFFPCETFLINGDGFNLAPLFGFARKLILLMNGALLMFFFAFFIFEYSIFHFCADESIRLEGWEAGKVQKLRIPWSLIPRLLISPGLFRTLISAHNLLPSERCRDYSNLF